MVAGFPFSPVQAYFLPGIPCFLPDCLFFLPGYSFVLSGFLVNQSLTLHEKLEKIMEKN